MIKSLVINGLHRSGTTMLERLIDSQPDMICFGHLFEMLRIIAGMRGLPEKDFIVRESFTSGMNRITEKSYSLLRYALMNSYMSMIAGISTSPHYLASEHNNIYGLSKDQLMALMDIISQHDPITDIAALLAAMGEATGVKVMATKWTYNHNYAPVFLDSPRAYWLELVRSPYATYSSEKKGGWDDLVSNNLNKEDALRFAATFRHERFLVVRYEDLTENTDKCLFEISEWLGEKVRNIKLLNRRGGTFHGNTSENVVRGNNVSFEDKAIQPYVGAIDNERWYKHLTGADIAYLNLAMNFHGVYPKEPTSLPSTAQGALRLARLRAIDKAKCLMKATIRPLGYTITRLPNDVSL